MESAEIAQEDRHLVNFCGYVPDSHIGAYYKGAFCLSFTSLYEGFGLPVLEAMNEGCPVVTSNTSSLPEVAGDAALLILPTDEEEHIKAYKRLLKEPSLVPQSFRGIYVLNPLTPILTTFRLAFFGFGYFNLFEYLISWVVTGVILFVGLLCFNKTERNFMDII